MEYQDKYSGAQKQMSELIQKNQQDYQTSLTQEVSFNEEQVQAIKDIICKGATDAETTAFIETCRQTMLNPFGRQIYLVKRWDSKAGRNIATPQVSIDGMRAVAQRSGEYEGQTQPLFCGEDGEWKEIWTGKSPPFACKAGVYRKGFREPLYAIAEWRSYVQSFSSGVSPMWKKFGTLMLAKCAEALALRKAFPNDLSGLYSKEEMSQAEKEGEAVQQKVNVTPDRDEEAEPSNIKKLEQQVLDQPPKEAKKVEAEKEEVDESEDLEIPPEEQGRPFPLTKEAYLEAAAQADVSVPDAIEHAKVYFALCGRDSFDDLDDKQKEKLIEHAYVGVFGEDVFS